MTWCITRLSANAAFPSGYRLRQKIAKNLQSRSRAIRTALKAYNDAAGAIGRPLLEWDKVSHYEFLEEFELLNDTRADISKEEWARVPVRETMRLARRVARAHEEILKVHDQARRVQTSIRDEDRLFAVVLDHLRRTRDPLHGAVLDYASRRRRANTRIMVHLRKLYAIPTYEGLVHPGLRAGAPLPALLLPSEIEALLAGRASASFSAVEVPTPTSAPSATHIGAVEARQDEEDEEDEDEDDEDIQAELTAVTDFIATLAS